VSSFPVNRPRSDLRASSSRFPALNTRVATGSRELPDEAAQCLRATGEVGLLQRPEQPADTRRLAGFGAGP
jgi:hypothetical protein